MVARVAGTLVCRALTFPLLTHLSLSFHLPSPLLGIPLALLLDALPALPVHLLLAHAHAV